MDFISRVESSYQIVEADIKTALKSTMIKTIEKAQKAQPITKSKKTRPPTVAPKFAKGGPISFADLTNTKKLIPFIEDQLQKTNPVDFSSKTWGRFTKNVVPRLLTALLLDMNIVPVKRKVEFVKYLDRILRPLAK